MVFTISVIWTVSPPTGPVVSLVLACVYREISYKEDHVGRKLCAYYNISVNLDGALDSHKCQHSHCIKHMMWKIFKFS